MISFRQTNRNIKNIINADYTILKRYVQTSTNLLNHQKTSLVNEENIFERYQDKLLYCSHLENKNKLGYARNIIKLNKATKQQNDALLKQRSIEPLPISLRYLNETKTKVSECTSDTIEEKKIHFPFQDTNFIIPNQVNFESDPLNVEDNKLDLEVRTRLELYNKSKDHLNWMNDYENSSIDTDISSDTIDWKVNYGTPNPTSDISNVSCGGCGSLLHCKDTAIPGYIPSEIYQNQTKLGANNLKAIICQRCHFLNNYNLALQVRVSSDDYPKVLKTIADRNRALVILMVDLLDMPCSIWPGIADLLGPGRPIVVIGNKVDLLPQDGKGFLERVKVNLVNNVRESGFAMSDIRHVSLISATTGYGIEDFITKLQSLWQYKGDVFLVGCTNVGKSSLFNALLQSDYCKSQATDLIQKATTSPWPGTTMNLLKFPILRPTGWRLYVRHKRLISSKKIEAEENKLRQGQFKETRNTKYATLIGHIDRTYSIDKESDDESVDPFSLTGSANASGKVKIGINEKDKEYIASKWCYDTPGVVQPDQIIHLLTTEELMLMIPKKMISPQTFSLEPMSSIFIAGLARLDYLDGPTSVRFTVFCSSNLPITICKTDTADQIYKDFIGTDMFSVPLNYPERLKHWPCLEKSQIFSVTGLSKELSCADMVLSSAGWISITPDCGQHVTLQGWTPEKRGIYLRDSLLPNSVAIRGKKIRHSCAYRNDKYYLK